MARLPIPGGDTGNWGTVLNDFLGTALNTDGTLKADVQTIAALKALDVSTLPDKSQTLVAGYYTAGDGGGGQFYYDTAATDSDNGGTVIAPNTGVGRWKRLHQSILYPQWFGAKGDGIADDSVAIQSCIAAAEARPSQTVYLAPASVFGVANTLILGQGQYPIRLQGPHPRHFAWNDPAAFTLKKLANIPVIKVIDNGGNASKTTMISGISILGRGANLPVNTDLSLDNTPAILIHDKCHLSDCYIMKTGGLAGLGESDTDSYVIGIYQFVDGNCNSCVLKNIAISRCRGDGVYIGREAGSILNVNAIRVELDSYFLSNGYAINASDGFRNHFQVRTAESSKDANQMKGVFKLLYVENYAQVQYFEGDTPLLVDFGDSGGRNLVEANDTTAAVQLTPDIRNNRIKCIQTGREWVGAGTGGLRRAIYGSSGLLLDKLELPSVGGAYSSITAATAGDFGTAVDLLYGANAGGVSWTVQEADTARIGKIVMIALRLEGTPSTTSTANARMVISRGVTGIDFENQNNTGIIGPLSLTNSVGTRLIYLRFNSIEQFQLVDANGASLNFNDVVGSGSFTLAGTISFLARSGQA